MSFMSMGKWRDLTLMAPPKDYPLLLSVPTCPFTPSMRSAGKK